MIFKSSKSKKCLKNERREKQKVGEKVYAGKHDEMAGYYRLTIGKSVANPSPVHNGAISQSVAAGKSPGWTHRAGLKSTDTPRKDQFVHRALSFRKILVKGL